MKKKPSTIGQDLVSLKLGQASKNLNYQGQSKRVTASENLKCN